MQPCYGAAAGGGATLWFGAAVAARLLRRLPALANVARAVWAQSSTLVVAAYVGWDPREFHGSWSRSVFDLFGTM